MLEVLSQNWFRPFASACAEVMNICAALERIPRTGWVRRGVPNPEDDLRHTGGMIELVQRLAPQLPELDLEVVCQTCFVHVWPEAADGFDEVVADLAPATRNVAIANKRVREAAGMRRLCESLGEIGKFAIRLYDQFDLGSTPEGRFAKQVDKYQAMEQAWRYERQRYTVRAMDFIDYDRAVIKHPVLLAELARLEATIASFA
jgi:putative hydrolase of HD superfamily